MWGADERTTMFRWKRAAVLATAVTVGISLAGCSGAGSTSTSSGSTGGTLTLGVLAAPASFAASKMQWANQSPLGQAAYDTLLHAAAKDNSPEPWLATSWSYSADKTVLTLKLKSGVKFSDGTAFDAAAAAQNLIRFRDGTAADKSHLAAMKDAKATDATTLVLTLSAPDPAMLSYLAQAPGQMESPKAFTSKTIDTVPVGTGPYILDASATVSGSKYVFNKNPNYWNKSTQYYSKVVETVLTTAQTELNAVKGGQVDGLNIVDPTIIDQVKTTQGFSVIQQDLDWGGLILLDRNGKDTPALKDVRVRQAINYAFDRAALLKAVAKGQGTVTTSVFPSYSPGYDSSLDNYYSYDPAKAKALLKEAGYSSFTLNLPRIAGFGDAANDLIKQYLGAVGIKVTFTPVQINNAITDVLAPKYSAAYFTLQEDPVAYQEANFLLSNTAVFNPYKVTDTTMTALIAKIQTGDEATANQATKDLNAYVVKQALMAPWYRQKNSFAVGPKITAQTQAGNTYPMLYNIKPKG
jgi:peptide/nickel transport system substrate-binding protein